MDLKLAITNYGEKELFSTLSHELGRRLPSSTVSWKRSMGKSTRTVSLSGAFENFKAANLKHSDTAGQNLYSQPFFHIFWTSCTENDEYKSKLKDSIGDWLKKLSSFGITDWLIVHAVFQDPLKANKPKMLLPRSSVFDKIRNEFCGKSQERCLQLWEPDKETLFTKSRESWNILVLQLQQLLIASFDKRLTQVEDRLRKMLEDHPKPNWSFEKYFMLREELALTMKSIGLYEDALMHYDELNAVFSQSIINFCQSKGQPSWLFRFTQPCNSWVGLCFYKTIIQTYKRKIKEQNATLLDIRNYLFIRISKLSLSMKRGWTIGPRFIEYLYAVVHELRMLKIECPSGSVALWIVSSCLNILPLLTTDDIPQDREMKISLAGIHDYARCKLEEIGELCALLPQTIKTEASEEMTKILLDYIRLQIDNDSSTTISACKILEEALISKETFQELYLDLSNKAIRFYRDAGRHRFAMVIATKLSKFYLLCGEFDVAEKFLEEALDVYRQQGWEQLYIDVLVPLAECFEKHQMHDRYLVALAPLSCAVSSLNESERRSYADKFLKLITSEKLQQHTLNSDPLLTIIDVKINLLKEIGHIGDEINVELSIQNNLPLEMHCELVTIGLRYSSTGSRRNTGEDTLEKCGRSNSDLIDLDDLPIVFQRRPTEGRESLKSTSNLMARIKNKLQSNTSSIKADGSGFKPKHNRTRSQPANLNSKVISDIRRDLDTMAGIHARSNSVDLQKDAVDAVKPSKIASDTELARSGVDFKRSVSLSQYDVIESPSSLEEVKLLVDSPLTQQRPRLQSNSSRHSLPEIELEPDPTPSQRLAAKNVKLLPGLNKIVLSDRITHEGRYALQALSCQAGRVQLYHLLVLPRRSKAFFVVNDPPKFTWTPAHNECYLAGNLQRLYFTMANGPGVIPKNSVVHITSTSRLLFCNVPPSSVMVNSHLTTEPPREGVLSVKAIPDQKGINTSAAITLPPCQPYENVQIFADVIAPVKNVTFSSNMAKHKLVLQCGWLDYYVPTQSTLPCVFYEPFSVSHQQLCSGNRKFVQIALQGLNPIQLQFDSPTLKCINNSSIQFELINDNVYMQLYAGEEFQFIWEMTKESHAEGKTDVINQPVLDCVFSIQFKTKDQDNFKHGSFNHSLTLENVKAIIQIETTITGETDDTNAIEIIEGQTTPISFTISYLGENIEDQTLDIICILEDSNYWRFADEQGTHRLSLERHNGYETTIHTNVVANVVGNLELPSLKIIRVADALPNGDVVDAGRTSSPEIDTVSGSNHSGSESTSAEGRLKRKSRLSSTRRTGSSLSNEDTSEFNDGEIVSLDNGKVVIVVDSPKE